MSDHFHPLADPEYGKLARRQCEADLDRILLNPDEVRIAAFLLRWGEGLRELIKDFDGLADENDRLARKVEAA